MTDIHLLELAALAMQKAGAPSFQNFSPAGYGSMPSICLELGCSPGAITFYWKPLHDDGDAFRLAAALKINVNYHRAAVCVGYPNQFIPTALVGKRDMLGDISSGQDVSAVTRRLIVEVAADIGRCHLPQDALAEIQAKADAATKKEAELAHAVSNLSN